MNEKVTEITMAIGMGLRAFSTTGCTVSLTLNCHVLKEEEDKEPYTTDHHRLY